MVARLCGRGAARQTHCGQTPGRVVLPRREGEGYVGRCGGRVVGRALVGRGMVAALGRPEWRCRGMHGGWHVVAADCVGPVCAGGMHAQGIGWVGAGHVGGVWGGADPGRCA